VFKIVNSISVFKGDSSKIIFSCPLVVHTLNKNKVLIKCNNTKP